MQSGLPAGVPSLDAPVSPVALALGVALTEALYRAFPKLLEPYGARGRAYAEHDDGYLAQWALDALELGRPALFRRNVAWLADVLDARGFPRAVFERALDELELILVRQSGATSDAVRALFHDPAA